MAEFSYQIKQGNTLWEITGGDRSKIEKIVEKNKDNGSLKDADTIFAGKNLVLDDDLIGDKFKSEYRRTETNPDGSKPAQYEYTIQQGNTLWEITGGDRSKIDKILKDNPGIDPKKLKIGGSLKLSEEVIDKKFLEKYSNSGYLKKIETPQSPQNPQNPERPDNPAQAVDFSKLAQSGKLEAGKSALKQDGTPDESVLSKNAQMLLADKQKELLGKLGITQYTENSQNHTFTVKIDGADHAIVIVKDGDDYKLVDNFTKDNKNQVNVYKINPQLIGQ